MSVREYIGARYIPLFADPIQWDASNEYEYLTIVTNQGASYVSRKDVPTGIQLDNADYWVKWADFNAQLQHYIDEVGTFDGRIDAVEDALPIADYSSQHTVSDVFSQINGEISNLNGKFPIASSDISDSAITTAKIADDAITSAKIADGAVNTAELADDAVTSAKIADGAVDTAELADDAVTSAKIADGAIIQSTLSADVSNKILKSDIATRFIGRIYSGNYAIQSCCYDGTYLYTFETNSTDTEVQIHKYNLNTNLLVGTKTLAISHANSAIYDPTTDAIYTISGTDVVKINKSTLEIISTIPTSFNGPNITIDPVTGRKYVCDYNIWPNYSVYECDFINSPNTHTKLFDFNADIPGTFNFVAGSLATQNLSVWNGEFFFAIASFNNNNNALIHLNPTTGQVDYLVSPDCENELYNIYEMQGGFFTAWGEYIFGAYARNHVDTSKNISCIFAQPIFGCKTTQTDFSIFYYNIRYSNAHSENYYLNPFKNLVNNAPVVYGSIDDAITLAIINRQPLRIETNVTIGYIPHNSQLYLYLNNDDVTVTFSQALVNVDLYLTGSRGATVDFNGIWCNGCVIKANSVTFTGTLNLGTSLAILTYLNTGTDATVNCRSQGILVSDATGSMLTMQNKANIYATAI